MNLAWQSLINKLKNLTWRGKNWKIKVKKLNLGKNFFTVRMEWISKNISNNQKTKTKAKHKEFIQRELF